MSCETPPRTIHWAILGTGLIATNMVQILKQLPSTQVVAVGSRTLESANSFGDRWEVPRRYASYKEACADPDVDVVYIASPSLRHPEDCRLALKHRKAVLCEKSMAPSYQVARELLDLAKNEKVLLIHGVWSRFFPAMKKVREIIDSGAIGEIRSARAMFCQNDGAGSCSALLETGIYCAQFLQWVLTPTNPSSSSSSSVIVRGAARKNHPQTGHDEYVAAMLEFPDHKVGIFECSLGHTSERSAAVYGTEGMIELPFPFWCPTQVKVTRMTGLASQTWHGPDVYNMPLPSHIRPLAPKGGGGGERGGEEEEVGVDKKKEPAFDFIHTEGLAYEVEEVNRCVRQGLLESPDFTSEQCLNIMQIITDIDCMSTNCSS